MLVAFATTSAFAGEIKRYPLDDRASYAVRISAEAPTTVIFPDRITALDGMNLSAKPEEAPVLLSHQPGASYFSVRALRPDARAAVNVILRDKVFALAFTAGGEADRSVTFYDPPVGGLPPTPGRRANTASWLGLLDRAKQHAALAEQYPAIAQQVEHATPGTASASGALTVTVEEVFRFAAEDALVCRLRLANRSDARVRYAAASLGLQVGTRTYPAVISDASGELPADSAETVWLAIAGEADGRRANLAVGNSFTLVWSPLP